MRHPLTRASSALRIVVPVVTLLGATSAALAQPSAPSARMLPGNGPEVQVELVRQDFSDCSNSNVKSAPETFGGTAWVARNNDGTTTVKVAITAKPNTTYHFFLKCVRILGDVTTYDEGEGGGLFTFPSNLVGNVFAFDMYPEGAPAGNKFQSVQVHFQ
jgi:hypothetical protein